MNKGDRLTRTPSVAYTKGLLNNPGENNCFLNSAVQVLFHLDVFRRSFREISGHFCVGESCIFCALKVIFTQIQYSDEAALPPDVLRQALAVTFKDQHRFQLQDMDDAAECLENILNRLHFHFAMNERDEICNAPHCISHRKFSMEIMEQTICNCGATSEPLPFSQLVHYVSVSALCHEADVLSGKLKGLNQDMFGHLLKRAVNQGDLRTCPGINCGKKISVQQSLLNCPDVVCIGLIWDSETPEVEQISQLLDCIDPVLRLPEVFPLVVDDTARKVELLLAGVVTYYGKHYSTFFYSNKMSTWFYFDDARVRKCGSEWERIRSKCCQNHYQPLLLLYVNPHGRPVSSRTAPSEVKLVDTKTLLASHENSRSRTSFSSEKTGDRVGGTLSVLHEPGGDAVDGLVSSSSSHSVASDRGSEKGEEASSPGRKRGRRTIRKLRGIGSDIKRALSRSRNSSPTREQNGFTSDSNRALSRSRNNSPIRDGSLADMKTTRSRSRSVSPNRERRITDSERILSGTANNSPSRQRTMSTGSFKAEKDEKNNDQKKQTSCDDLIDFGSDPKLSTKQVYSSPSSRSREVDEVDSGVGSSGSQASSPATSSVSSVDTTTDDLIDFTSKTYSGCRGNDVKIKFENMINDAENLLRRSRELEKADLPLSLSLATNAAARFRIAMENAPPLRNSAYLAMLKEKYNICVERSRDLHRQITERNNNAMTTTRFSQQEKQKLMESQRERDQQILKEIIRAPAAYETLQRSTVKDASHVPEVVPFSSQAVNDSYFNNRSDSPSAARRGGSRSFHSGTMGNARDEVNCTQKIKPDAMCYSPVHYVKPNGLNNDLERLNLAHDRSTTVTRVSTSFIPVRSLPVDQMLPTSTVLPNSRNLRNTDIRRCSIYDNMPSSFVRDTQTNSSYPQRNTSSSHPNSRGRSEVGDSRRSWGGPTYVDPPRYSSSRASSKATQANSRNASGNLLQRFNVPIHSETRSVPGNVRWINESVRNSRKLCSHCGKTFVEKNATFCRPCQDLNHMLYDLNDTAVQY